MPVLFLRCEATKNRSRRQRGLYTLNDLLGAYKPARMIALMNGVQLGEVKTLLQSKRTAFVALTTYFKPFLPQLSQKGMVEILEGYRNLKVVRKFRKRGPEGRLYPLSREQYHEFARRAWLQRGSPKFGKRIISGVKWGQPEILTNGEKGWDRVIYGRWIGCRITGRKIVFEVEP